jgi:hypothetical protein
MALRIEAAACLIAFAALLPAQELRYTVRHEHWHKGGEGVLAFDDRGVSFEEAGKKDKHSRRWEYEQIQRFELSPAELRIVTYDDVRWRFDRDREYVFDRVPKEMAAQLYPVLSAKLDQRFIAMVPGAVETVVWSAPAKMLRGWAGSNGVLKAGGDRIVFESPEESRTWRYSDIEGITNEGPLELSVASLDGVTRFQLKRVLPEAQYNDLWRRISEANGLKAFHSQMENHHHD